MPKRRLAKFNGIRKDYFDDYLKQTKWKFNLRGHIEARLRKLIRKGRT